MRPVVVLALLAGAFLSVAVILLIAGDYRLVVRLRRDHHATWRDLGSPSPYFTYFEHLTAINRFLSERQYEALGDDSLARDADRLRRLTTVVYLLGALTFGLTVVAKAGR